MYPAQENQSTNSSSYPFDLRMIGIIGKAPKIAIMHQLKILKLWFRFKKGIIRMPTVPWIVNSMRAAKIKKKFIVL